MKHTSILRRAAALLLSALLPAAALCACSDQVLNEDGTIGTRGVTGTSVWELPTEPGGETKKPGGDVTLHIETETSDPGLNIGGDEDPFAGDPHRLYVDFLKTGESDAILIRADDTVILMDTGESDDASAIKKRLTGYGITAIDILILTHYDNDHIGSASAILSAFPVHSIYMPDYVRSSSLYRKLAEKLESLSGTEIHRLSAEDVDLSFDWGSLWINATSLPGHEAGSVLGSDEDNVDTEENNYSLITSLTFGSASLLLAGDAEKLRMGEFNELAAARGVRRYALIKIPHHGTSADKELQRALDTFLPRYCVVCAGSEAGVEGSLVTKMRSIGVGRYFTYDGTVRFASNGSAVTVTQEK